MSDLFEAKTIFQKEKKSNSDQSSSKDHNFNGSNNGNASNSKIKNDSSKTMFSSVRFSEFLRANKSKLSLIQNTLFEIVKNSTLGTLLFSTYESVGLYFDKSITGNYRFSSNTGDCSSGSEADTTEKPPNSQLIEFLAAKTYLFSPFVAGKTLNNYSIF
jgi:hypothetical protein